MKKVINLSTACLHGSHLQGRIMADVSDLVEMFGSPFMPPKEDKITMEWSLLFVDEETGESVPATIYDWKRSPGWSVGGYSHKAVEMVETFLRGL
jgi:hypothetical protein